MICRIFLIFLTIGFVAIENAIGQTEPLKVIEKQLNAYSENNLQEKIFAHLDKSFYLAGEKIWFKLYNVDGIIHKPLAFSKVAYVELVNNENKPVLQGKIELKDGLGNGSFYIPTNFNSGKYVLRAYTSWMKNSSTDFFFHKEITVVNSLKRLGVKQEANSTGFDIQFFPEGGNIVAGIEGKIAFIATDNNSKGIAFKGFVLNQKNDTLARFKPLKFGIGNFLLKPVSAEKYRAVIVSDGKTIAKELPAILEQGYALRLEEDENNFG